MPRETSDNRKIKNRQFAALPPGHISALLLSNSGQVPLKNLGYRIVISPERVLEGTTDSDGLVEHDNVPLGEYRLELAEWDGRASVPAMPTDIERYPVRVMGYTLFADDTQFSDDDMDDFEQMEEIDLNQVDSEGWEDMGGE